MWLASSALDLFKRCNCALITTVQTNASSKIITTYDNVSIMSYVNFSTLCANLNVSDFSEFNCPYSSSRSTIAHVGLGVSIFTTAIHLALIFTLRGGLIRLYGPCILTSMWSNLLHSALLFASSQLSSVESNIDDIGYIEKSPSYNSVCLIIDSTLHATALVTHLSLMFGLVAQYRKIKQDEWNHNDFVSKDFLCLRNCRSSQTPLYIPTIGTQEYECRPNDHAKAVTNRHSVEEINHTTAKAPYFWSKKHKVPRYTASRRHHCCPDNLHIDWFCLGPPLSVLLSLFPVSFGTYSTLTYELNNPLNLAYGFVNCGGVGSCLPAFQWLLYLPLGFVFACDSVFIILVITQPAYSENIFLAPQAVINDHLQFRAQFGMHCKMIVSQMLVWLTAFLSNHICLISMWQLYAILTGLQSLYLIVSFVLSRPFLEVIFKRNDPLRHLKLDNLAMSMPLAMRPSDRLSNLSHSTPFGIKLPSVKR